MSDRIEPLTEDYVHPCDAPACGYLVKWWRRWCPLHTPSPARPSAPQPVGGRAASHLTQENE